MRETLVNDRAIFNLLTAHETLRKLRIASDFLLGHPLWWVSFKPNVGSKTLQKSIESSYEIWHDPRAKKFRAASQILTELKKRAKETHPFLFQDTAHTIHFIIPLVISNRVIGALGLIDVRNGTRREILNLISVNARSILADCEKTEELNRLSATIRPRAIALSTVHTVHRIINSTLNLDELLSRLAHLIAQVLRASRSVIYLVGPFDGRPRLIGKAQVGYPKNKNKNVSIAFGQGIEGRVAKTAQIALRKNSVCVPLIDEDVIGVISVSHKKDRKEFTYFDQEILATLSEEAVIAIKNAQLYEEQKKVTLGTIQSLAVILGTRIPDAVSPEAFLRLALKMAEELRLSDEETQALHYATLLKDTAKIGIPDEILKKPTKLTGKEYRLLREHPVKGAKIVQSFESLKPVVPMILYSREKYDGSGYPKGLKGEKIPIGARILSVINAFEAIIIGRPYRGRSSMKEALDEILRNSGTQFDPKVVEAFIKIVRREDFGRFFKSAV